MDKISTDNMLQAKSAQEIARNTKAMEQAKSLSKQDVKSEEEVKKAASGFEALLLHEMLQSMWSTVEFSGMLNEKSNEAEIYRDMLNEAIADSAVKGRGIGVKDLLQKELTKHLNVNKENES